MTKLNYNRPKWVPPPKRLDDGWLPGQRHGGTSLGPLSGKGKGTGRSKVWIACMHCNIPVRADKIERHTLGCPKAKKFEAEVRRMLMGKEPCPLCQKRMRSMKDHLLHKHGFDLTPSGSFVIRCGFIER